MVLRWLPIALVETSKIFRKLRVYAATPKLLAALRDHDATLNSKSVDASKQGA